MRPKMRHRLYRFENDLAVFGQAFKEATCPERLGVVNAIDLKNKMEALQDELEDTSEKIERVKEEKSEKIRRGRGVQKNGGK